FGISQEGNYVGHVYSNGLQKELGCPQPPILAQTLDEIVLILRKSSGLTFDANLPGFHLYGTDMCIQARKRNLDSYVISNFCVHNSMPVRYLPREFWGCVEHIRQSYYRYLPLKTTCCIIYKNTISMLVYKLIYRIRFLLRNLEKTFMKWMFQKHALLEG